MSHFNLLKSIEEQFRGAMIERRIPPPATIHATEILQRYHIQGDRPGTKNGWYVLYPNGIASGAFGSWKIGTSYKWCTKTQDRMTQKEWKEHLYRLKDARSQREKAKAIEQCLSAKRAIRIWQAAKPANLQHSYLIKKHILPYIARQRGKSLILPIVNFNSQICSLQFIYNDGTKILLSGGAKQGNFIQIHGSFSASVILICEGYATGATLAQAQPEACVIAAIDAGNLKAVAVGTRYHYPKVKIIVCADDDRLIPGNPGVTKGLEAAKAALALFITPQWPKETPNTFTDFNDLYCWHYDRGAVI